MLTLLLRWFFKSEVKRESFKINKFKYYVIFMLFINEEFTNEVIYFGSLNFRFSDNGTISKINDLTLF